MNDWWCPKPAKTYENRKAAGTNASLPALALAGLVTQFLHP